MDDPIAYMYSLERLGIAPRLDVMEQLMGALGNPETRFKSVHIAGTNGKGSVAAMMESVLRRAGCTTGMYTSPHIYTFHERIRVNGANIPNNDLAAYVAKVRNAGEAKSLTPTFFEFTTAIALLYFADQNVDIAVIEVGMGGTWDATNVITPVVSVITSIGMDHMEFLGSSLNGIAAEKAGIIKQGGVVVTAPQREEVMDVIHARAAEVDARVRSASTTVRVVDRLSGRGIGQRVTLSGVYNGTLTLPLRGEHQITNLAAALAALNELHNRDFPVSWDAVQNGIANVRWEGRLDVVSEHPYVLIDGAHNEDSIMALAQYLKHDAPYDVLLVGTKKRRDAAPLIRHMLPLVKHVVTTDGSFQSEDTTVLARALAPHHRDVVSTQGVVAALERAYSIAGTDGTIVVTGSLYMTADVLQAIRSDRNPLSFQRETDG